MFVLLLSKIFSRKTVKRVSQMFLRKKREKKTILKSRKRDLLAPSPLLINRHPKTKQNDSTNINREKKKINSTNPLDDKTEPTGNFQKNTNKMGERNHWDKETLERWETTRTKRRDRNFQTSQFTFPSLDGKYKKKKNKTLSYVCTRKKEKKK